MADGAARPAPTGLPVEAVVGELATLLDSAGSAVLQAEPGAGKTTVVPLRLLGQRWLGEQRIVLLEPRRVAARAAATRMAALLGEPVGATVGLVTRDERRVSGQTRIEVVTDGILTRRLQRDPALEGTGLVIFDEFHERHLQADLGLALTLDARDALRPDLRVLVMSATIDTGSVSALLGGAPVVSSSGSTHGVAIRWRPRRPEQRLEVAVAAVVREALGGDDGDVLAFLPGVGEIRSAQRAIGGIDGIAIVPLHGTLPPVEQDRALRGGSGRRVILATDIAESSVTVEGVRIVVDAGLVRRPRYDPSSGLSRLHTSPNSRASADQRAGRAGRTAPGIAYRLWSEGEHLSRRPWPDPEIIGADLASLTLELASWGATPGDLRWLDAPPTASLAVATGLLADLGALADGRMTELGRVLVGLPLHPRLARMLAEAGPDTRATAAALAAILTERDVAGGPGHTGGVDVAERLAVLERTGGGRGGAVTTVRRRAEELLRRFEQATGDRTAGRATRATRADPGPLLALAFPDRIARARSGSRYLLRHGGGASLPDHDPLTGTEWIVAADIDGGGGAGSPDGRIRLAAVIDERDVEEIAGGAIATTVRLAWDDRLDDLRQTTVRSLDAIVLDEVRSPVAAGDETARLLIEQAVRRSLTLLGWTQSSRALQARAAWARSALGAGWPDVSDRALADSAGEWLEPLVRRATGRADLTKVDPGRAIRALLGERAIELDRLVPKGFALPGGRIAEIDYGGDHPRISVRAQDLYGLRTHPTVALGRVPVTVELLSPAGRPIQVTGDLPGFWGGTWRAVRKEMAIRYPKHHWPEDPSVDPTTEPRARRRR